MIIYIELYHLYRDTRSLTLLLERSSLVDNSTTEEVWRAPYELTSL